MGPEWFEKWFDTEYYYLLYADHDEREAREFILNLMSYLRIPRQADVIDSACGKGRHAVILGELGYRVTGIDIAKGSIRQAKRYESDCLHFHCHDNRRIFRKNHYDLALNLFTSFGYLEDLKSQETALISMATNLKKGGIFVLDYFNPENVQSTLCEWEKINRNEVTFNIAKSVEEGKIVKRIEVIDGGETQIYEEKVQIIALDEFRHMFPAAGLEISDIFGDYRLNSFDALNSERLILIARKQ